MSSGNAGWSRGAFENLNAVLTSCTELTRECGVQDELCPTLETARHSLTTAREKAGECGFSMRSARGLSR